MSDDAVNTVEKPNVEIIDERLKKTMEGQKLYNQGSRNFLLKNYYEAADELSQACAVYVELFGTFSKELGDPYLMYAKALIALSLDENKVIDVPDEEADDGDDDDDEEQEAGDGEENEAGNDAAVAETNGEAAAAPSTTNGEAAKLNSTKEEETVVEKKSDEADSTVKADNAEKPQLEKISEEAQVSSTEEVVAKISTNGTKSAENGEVVAVLDGEKPSTSNGDVENCDEEEEETETANLQLAWEMLECAAKIFSNMGIDALPKLAEVHTELANIELENNTLDVAREDYEKALKIYADLPDEHRRAMAEIHYKIGLTYLMEQLNKEGAKSFKEACNLIEAEILEIKAKSELTEKDKNTILDLEETKEEILAKITEIEETKAQTIVEMRAALDNYIKPAAAKNDSDAGPSSSSVTGGPSSSSAISSSSSKPKDISHLIKRKKPEEPTSEAEAASSPAKRAAL